MNFKIPDICHERIRLLLARGGRQLLGIAAAPGAGKSTLAQALQVHYGPQVQLLPMDGFHLANVQLQRLGRQGRKGAPDTFDVAGYVHLLRRLRSQPADEVVYAPEFRREIEEPVAGAIAVRPETALVITEGNYLLLEMDRWSDVYPLLDETWYLDVDDDARRMRLIQRHMRFGRTPAQALAWADGTDEPNARLIAQYRQRSDVQIQIDECVEPESA